MQMPRFVPPWDTLMDDLGHPAPELIARALGVGRSTVYRWNSAGHAPRAASLAVFWLTRWGRSEIDARATNDALMALQLARSLADDLAALRGQPARQGDCLRPATAAAGGKTRNQNSASCDAITDFYVVGTETSPPLRVHDFRTREMRARVAPSMPPKKPRKR